MQSIEKNIIALIERIANYEKKYERARHSVTLLAASKGQSIEKIKAAFHAGLSIFGENYLQEALPKIMALANESIEWHFIGPIQSNKTRKIAEYFSWVHSVDSIKIAKRLNEQRPSHLPPLNICIEVNVSGEATKSGIKPAELFSLAEYCTSLPHVSLRGLMTIPPLAADLSMQRKYFHALYLLSQHLREKGFNIDTLSMGMSDDLEAAIAEGATLVRIGSALFGKRPTF